MKNSFINSLLRLLIRVLMRLTTTVQVSGIQNLPREGGYIVVANHLGRMDIPLVYYLLDRDDVILLVAEKYRKYGIVRWLVVKLDALWLDRFSADIQALRRTLSRLKTGDVLVIAPEGTRSPTGALIEGKPGASYLAAKSGVPILPVAAIGTEDASVKDKLRHLQRIHIAVRVGKAFHLPPLDGRHREEMLQRSTDEIMCQIAALLPESYRGVYTDHPRLQELLAAGEVESDNVPVVQAAD